MTKPRIQLNKAGMKDLLRSSGVRRDLARRGGRVLSAARAAAPVATGEYRGSLRDWSTTTDRAVHRVGSDAAHARVVEARTGNLARALDSGAGR